MINILAHRALLVAYTKGVRRVGPAEVNLAAIELEQCRIPLRARKNSAGWAYKAGSAAAVAVAAGAVAFLLVAPLGDDGRAPTAGVGPSADEQKPKREQRGGRTVRAGGDRARAVQPAGDPDREELAKADPEASRSAAEKLARRLQRTEAYDAAAGAMSRLLELWTGRALTPAETASGSLDLQLLGARRGLRYLAADMTTQQLAALDIPAVVELRIPDESETRYVLLEGLDRKEAALFLEKPYRTERSALERLWGGSVHLLWRDPERLSRPLAKGSKGPAVEKLQRMLAEAGYLEEGPRGDYDEATEDAVRRLQRARGLVQTGEASTLTQIILYNAIERYERPELRTQDPARVAGKLS